MSENAICNTIFLKEGRSRQRGRTERHAKVPYRNKKRRMEGLEGFAIFLGLPVQHWQEGTAFPEAGKIGWEFSEAGERLQKNAYLNLSLKGPGRGLSLYKVLLDSLETHNISLSKTNTEERPWNLAGRHLKLQEN